MYFTGIPVLKEGGESSRVRLFVYVFSSTTFRPTFFRPMVFFVQSLFVQRFYYRKFKITNNYSKETIVRLG